MDVDEGEASPARADLQGRGLPGDNFCETERRSVWCAPGGAGGWCRRVLVGEDVQPLDVGAVLPRAVVPNVLPDQSAQCLECEVFVLRFVRRRSCSELMRSPAEWARPQVRLHGLQNQCSCSVPPQPRSCPRSGLPSSSFTSMQTPHGFPVCGCGASPSGILRRDFVCRTIGSLHGRGSARSGRRNGRCLAVAAGPCVWLVARLCKLVVDEEVIIRAAVVGCLLCFLCVYLDAVL